MQSCRAPGRGQVRRAAVLLSAGQTPWPVSSARPGTEPPLRESTLRVWLALLLYLGACGQTATGAEQCRHGFCELETA